MRKIAANKNYTNLKKKASPADPNAMNRHLQSQVDDLIKRVYELEQYHRKRSNHIASAVQDARSRIKNLEQIIDSDGYKRSRLNNTVYED